MSIRRQSIISSILVYIGFAVGLVNTYLYAKGFAEAEYGLVQGAFMAFSSLMFSISNVGLTYYVAKFFPYYNDNLPPKKNDMITIALAVSLTAFLFVLIAGLVFKSFVIRKYSENSPELIQYYYWLFPFGFGLTLFSILEVFTWQLRKSVVTNFLKEIVFRLLATILIVLTFMKVIKDFDLFIKLFSFTYIAIALALVIYLMYTRQLHITFTISRVTRKYLKKILGVAFFVWGGTLVYNIAQIFDTLVIGSVVTNGMASVGVYTLAQNMSSMVHAPQRAIVSAAMPPLSQAWKDKDYDRINRIYQRSSINQLLFAVAIFSLIWLNFTDGVLTFHLKQGYLDARYIFLIIGITKIIDMGTGVNSQIISTSIYWKVEFVSGIVLLALTIPLNYFFTKNFGPVGTASANLISGFIYNSIRYFYLLNKFKMQPFSLKTLYALFVGGVCFVICFLLFNNFQGLGWIVLRSGVFVTIFLAGVLMLKLSPDVIPVLDSIKKRMKLNKHQI
jgi:O-antigen/teichoic acid export membrane protein